MAKQEQQQQLLKRKRSSDVALSFCGSVDFPSSPERRRGLGEPDVTVVVGGAAFRHHGFLLCYASEYFDAMLSSGMQEARNKRIEFPDRDPEEWKLVYPFLEPRSVSTAVGVRITKENAKAILPWFHEFGMTQLLKESDERLWSCLLLFKHGYYPASHRSLEDRRNTMTEILGWTDTAETYGLEKTRDAMVKELKVALTSYPELITKPFLEQMSAFWTKDETLWEAVKARLPQEVTSNYDDATLKENPLFLDVLALGFRMAHLEKRLASLTGGPGGQFEDAADGPSDESDDDAMMFAAQRRRWDRLVLDRQDHPAAPAAAGPLHQQRRARMAQQRRMVGRRRHLLARQRAPPPPRQNNNDNNNNNAADAAEDPGQRIFDVDHMPIGNPFMVPDPFVGLLLDLPQQQHPPPPPADVDDAQGGEPPA